MNGALPIVPLAIEALVRSTKPPAPFCAHLSHHNVLIMREIRGRGEEQTTTMNKEIDTL
jgi:hypothetical protein